MVEIVFFLIVNPVVGCSLTTAIMLSSSGISKRVVIFVLGSFWFEFTNAFIRFIISYNDKIHAENFQDFSLTTISNISFLIGAFLLEYDPNNKHIKPKIIDLWKGVLL